MHIEFLLEEPSAEAALEILLPKLGLTGAHSFSTHTFQGKLDLMQKLPNRLVGYSRWLLDDWRIVVLVDRDREDCKALKNRLERIALEAGLLTRREAGVDGRFHIVNRIAVEELEAWYFGDVDALCKAYSGVPATLGRKKAFRDPDAIGGGTWERLEQVLHKAGHCPAGFPKIEAARSIAAHMEPDRNSSKSFCVFRDAVRQLLGT